MSDPGEIEKTIRRGSAGWEWMVIKQGQPGDGLNWVKRGRTITRWGALLEADRVARYMADPDRGWRSAGE